MKKAVLILICLTVALLMVVGAAFAQKAVDLSGTWTGYAIVGDGSRLDFNLALEKGEEGYTGKITDDAQMMPEMLIKEATFEDNTLSFVFDFTDGYEVTQIKIHLTYENDTLKGYWTDPDGSQDIVELERKK